MTPLFPVKTFAPSTLRFLLPLGVLSLATAAQAEDEAIYFSDLPVVASVSRLPQRLADAPTAVTVIDRDIIKASGVRDLNDIFRLVPGFQTYPNTTETARVSYHGMGEGDYAPRVQVLVDGRSMYSPLFGGGRQLGRLAGCARGYRAHRGRARNQCGVLRQQCFSWRHQHHHG